MTYKTDRDEQFLRKVFDAAYQVTPHRISDAVRSTSKRTRWTIAILISLTVLTIVIGQFAQYVIAEMNESPIPEWQAQLEPPYGLTQRPLPVVELEVTDIAEGEEAVDLVAAAQGEADTAKAEGPVVLPAAITEDFQVLPQFSRYEQRGLESYAVHGAIACLLNVDNVCGLSAAPIYIEANDYVEIMEAEPVAAAAAPDANEAAAASAEQAEPVAAAAAADEAETVGEEEIETLAPLLEAQIPTLTRIIAAQFETEDDAEAALRAMQFRSREVGRLGNFAFSSYYSVDYFYALDRNQQLFAWSHDNWVYTISADTMDRVESIAKIFPY